MGGSNWLALNRDLKGILELPMDSDRITFRDVCELDREYLLVLRRLTMNPHYANAGIVPSEDLNAERVLDHYAATQIIEVDGRRVGMVKSYRSRAID